MNSTKKNNAEALKKVMRRLPFPVTIITAAVGKEKRGITIGSFTSLSMDPPLISFNLDYSAQMHPLIKKATHFAVHFPGREQSGLCNHFAIPDLSGAEQFDVVAHRRSAYGTPVLEDALAVIQCRSYTRFEAGDHSIIVGEVIDTDQPKQGASVLYYDQSYRIIGDLVSD